MEQKQWPRGSKRDSVHGQRGHLAANSSHGSDPVWAHLHPQKKKLDNQTGDAEWNCLNHGHDESSEEGDKRQGRYHAHVNIHHASWSKNKGFIQLRSEGVDPGNELILQKGSKPGCEATHDSNQVGLHHHMNTLCFYMNF
jgi:hypothetical protein